MSEQNFTQICERWLSKAEGYDSEKIEDIFDKFFTLFVAYNSLYSEINHRQNQSSKGKDRESATERVPNYLGYSNLAAALRQKNETHEAICEIIKLIKENTFCIHADYKNKKGDEKKGDEEDRKCIEKIENGTDKEFTESLLVLIYQTRCNMFHGAKELYQIQEEILTPMNIVLENVIHLVLRELRNNL